MTKCQVCESTEPMRLCANKSTEKVDVDECSRLLITEAKLAAAQKDIEKLARAAGWVGVCEPLPYLNRWVARVNAKVTVSL